MDTSPYSTCLAAVVAEAMTKASITKLALSDTTGIPRETLSRRLRGQTSFTADEIARIATALGILPSALFLAAEVAA